MSSILFSRVCFQSFHSPPAVGVGSKICIIRVLAPDQIRNIQPAQCQPSTSQHSSEYPIPKPINLETFRLRFRGKCHQSQHSLEYKNQTKMNKPDQIRNIQVEFRAQCQQPEELAETRLIQYRKYCCKAPKLGKSHQLNT